MNKVPVTALIVIFLFSFQEHCITKPAEPHVKGGFKSCTVTEYRYKDGKLDMNSGVKSFGQIFDDKGFQCELISYENNKISQRNKIENKYNSKGLLVETVYFDVSGRPVTKYTYGYDDKMNKIYDTNYSAAGEVTTRGFFKYDDNNFLVEEAYEIKIDSNQFVKGTTYFKNDKNGNKIEESAVHSSNVSVQVSSEINLEDSNSKNEVTTEDSSAPPEKVTYEYKYDDNQRIIKEIRFGIGGTKLIKGYSYDKHGNITEEIYFDDNDKPVMKRVYVYS